MSHPDAPTRSTDCTNQSVCLSDWNRGVKENNGRFSCFWTILRPECVKSLAEIVVVKVKPQRYVLKWTRHHDLSRCTRAHQLGETMQPEEELGFGILISLSLSLPLSLSRARALSPYLSLTHAHTHDPSLALSTAVPSSWVRSEDRTPHSPLPKPSE